MAEKRSIRRLSLPGGGTFDLEMPRDGGSFLELSEMADAEMGAFDPFSDLTTVLIGAALGGVLTWIFLRGRR